MNIENRESQQTMALRVDLGNGTDINGVVIYVIPKNLTTAKLQTDKTMIDNGNLFGFYNYIASEGYGYAKYGK